jgi:hypothetical protein
MAEIMYHHSGGILVVLAAGVLAASLPDLGQPTFFVFAAAVGALIGTAIGRWRHQPRERIRQIAENWSFAFGLVGLALYLAALAGIIRTQ